MRVAKEYGYGTLRGVTGVIADWACDICPEVVYRKTHAADVKKFDLCDKCIGAAKKAEAKVEEFWPKTSPDFYYVSRRTGNTGAYAVRDDLFGYYRYGEKVPTYLMSKLRKAGVSL